MPGGWFGGCLGGADYVGPHVDACSLQPWHLARPVSRCLPSASPLSPAVELNVHEWDVPLETSVVRRLLWALGLLMAASWAAVRKPFGEVDPV